MATELSPLVTHSKAYGLGRNATGHVQIAPSHYEMEQTEPASLLSQTTALTESGGVHVVDLNELLQTLERASSIIKSHMQNTHDVVIAPRGQKRPKPLIPRWITSYLFLITLAWQALSVGLVEVLEVFQPSDSNSTTTTTIELSSNVVMTVFQAINLVLVLFVTFKLVKQVIHHTASGSLIAQSYLSTVLLFAGLFMLEYRFDNASWKNVTHGRETRPVLIFLRMLYFSVSTATLCGTTETEPVKFFTYLTVSMQMLISFVYFASILSLTMLPRKRSRFDPLKTNTKRSITARIRRLFFKEND